MGCFDTLTIKCPQCGDDVSFQSKSGDCILEEYNINNVPEDVVFGLNNVSEDCLKCKRTITIGLKLIPYYF